MNFHKTVSLRTYEMLHGSKDFGKTAIKSRMNVTD